MEYLVFVLIQFTATGIIYAIMGARIDAQDKYLSNYVRGISAHNGEALPPYLHTTEVKEEITRKPEVYSPRFDPETVMKGKVLDPFD
jgi:hypothetical protein